MSKLLWWQQGGVALPVVRTLGEFGELEPGTRIATNNNRLLIKDMSITGKTYWTEEGEIMTDQPTTHWLPAIILPAVVTAEEWHGRG